MSVPTREQFDNYIASVEELIVSSYDFVTDLDAINDSVQRLWMHVSRFGPPEMPDIRLPSLGRFEVPAPPPPPPPPPPTSAWYEDLTDWASRNKRLIGAMCVGAVGAGLLAGYSASTYARARARLRRTEKTIGSSPATSRLVVVVLGGDLPLGPPLISGLVKEGYIVITSVSNPDTVAEVEASGNGYVRALVFDPSEPATLQPFLKSLKATLSLRFPLNSAGDPYQHSPTSFPIIFSIVSLLTLPPASTCPTPAPFEHLELGSTYETHLLRTHIMPLQVIQALMPLFRVDSVRAQDSMYAFGGRRSIVFCVPAADARVGVPYASAQAMSAAATVRGAEVLRRELKQVSDPQMRDVRVVVADIGVIGRSDSLGLAALSLDDEALARSISSWTPGEQRVYTAPYTAFVNAITQRRGRKPTGIDRFVKTLVGTVGWNAVKHERRSVFSVGLRLWAYSFYRIIKGDRLAVGAGARAYTVASYLPSFLLDALLNLPATLMSVRNKYLPVAPRIPPNLHAAAPEPVPAEELSSAPEQEISANDPPATPLAASESHHTTDARSSVLEGSAVDHSWISVQD
ncbi:hypothetical protein ACEPAG_5328 [Sanghuangporus baumii]